MNRLLLGLTLAALLVPATAWGAPAPAARIISLAPSTTEMLFAVGAGPQVVGVSSYCDYPPAARALPRIGDFLTPNLEAIIGLRPTLIVGLETAANQRQLRALAAMGYPTLLVGEDSLAEIRAAIVSIGARTGHRAQAHAVLARIDAQLAAVARRLHDVPPRKVLMVVGHSPMVAVGHGYLDQLLLLAHDDNIAATLGQEWPRVSIEYIIEMAPAVIIDGQMGDEHRASGGFWSRYSEIPAVKDHRIYGYSEDPMLHPGPRVGESLEILARLSHPEAFAGAASRPLASAAEPSSTTSPSLR